jgi:hypothetical protein
MTKWTPRTHENRMLLEYWKRVGGRIYTEVPLAGSRGHEEWTAESTTRRLDAVRFPANSHQPGLVSFRQGRAEFLEDVEHALAWLIEVKPSINRSAIGQVIVGADLFQLQYGAAPAKSVIVCTGGASALEWVCRRRFIEVFKVPTQPISPHNAATRCHRLPRVVTISIAGLSQ